MEADKENVHRTRIPIPLNPLPALPKHLLKENKMVNLEYLKKRCPLKTINSQTVVKPGPSNVKVTLRKSNSFKLDTKHVTLRKNSEDLDWDFKVFKDKKPEKDASIISISDDETLGQNRRNFVENKKGNELGQIATAVTPLKVCLEPRRVRNIKRSLKRPHSIELQGRSAPVDQINDTAKRRLQFNDRVENSSPPDYWKLSYLKCLNQDYTADVFKYLLETETKPLAVPKMSSITRACVINWLMKVNGRNGNPATIQSACWYLDSLLGTGQVQLDKLQLVAAACYWIAQKLQGPVVPALRLVNCANKAFTADRLLAAEKAILLRLQFPRQPVVPQEFITYLSCWCDLPRYGEIESAATFLCMSGVMVDKVLCEEMPSVIAAAAVRNALLLLGKKELIERLQICAVYKAAEAKAVNLSFTCSILRRAVRTVAAPIYEYKAPLEHYGGPPSCIAQRIVSAASELSLIDARNTDRSKFNIQQTN